MVFVVFHFPCNIIGHRVNLDLISSTHEDMDVSQVLVQNLLEFDLRFQILTNQNSFVKSDKLSITFDVKPWATIEFT